jgi:transposase
MNEHGKAQPIAVIGIDLAKRSFHLCGMDIQGRRVFSKPVSRVKLAEHLAGLSPCLVAMEACGSAHYWARTFQSYGHEVKLIAPSSSNPSSNPTRTTQRMPMRLPRRRNGPPCA